MNTQNQKMTVMEITAAGRKHREAWERHRALMDSKPVVADESGAGNSWHFFTNEAGELCAEAIGPYIGFRIAA